MTVLKSGKTATGIGFPLSKAIFMEQAAGIGCPGPVVETISGWGQYSSHIPPGQQLTIDKLADIIVSSFDQWACAPFRTVSIVGHADKDWHGPKVEATVSLERATTVQKVLTASVKKLWDMRNMGPPPVGGVEWESRGEGAKHMIAPAFSPSNRRVVVTLAREGAPLPVITNNKVIAVTAKSFIAPIGSRVGSMPGTKIVVLPPIPPGLVPIRRQTLLEALARETDSQFSENPRNAFQDKGYRLFSRCQFTVVFENKKVLAAVPSALDVDVGNEGPLQPPSLITSPVKVSPTGGSSVTFSWSGTGRPHQAAELTFQEVQSRTSVFIWHAIEGKIDVSSGTPVTTVSIRGSQFPSHRIFVDNVLVLPELVQGPFSNLWVADPTDSTRVK